MFVFVFCVSCYILSIFTLLLLKGAHPSQVQEDNLLPPYVLRPLRGMLYGLINQGVRCTDCGVNVHSKCSGQVPKTCGRDHMERRGRIRLAFRSEELDNDYCRIYVTGLC